MTQQLRNLFVAAICGTILGSQALAVPVINCIDHEQRYILQDFVPSGQGHLASLTFIDAFERENISLFCGFDPTQTNRTEIACVSSHLGNEGQVIRARVHTQRQPDLPRIALIEIQESGNSPGNINDIIPLVCQ